MVRKNKKYVLVILALAMIISGGVAFSNNQIARGVDLCATDECKEAKAKAEAAEDNSDKALDSAKVYEMKVAELSNQISAQEEKISKSEDKIDELQDEIKKTEANLKKKQEALADMLVSVHFDNEAEPIKILAGSNSISDLAEKASREEVARKQVSVAAGAVRDAKEKLEDNKKQVEELLAEQQETRKTMVATRKEQKDIMKQYQEDADAFAKEAQEARTKQRELEQAYQEEHPELFVSSLGKYYGARNSYDYQADCPQKQDWYVDVRGYYVCECTSYAAQKVEEAYPGNVWYAWGNAGDWYYTALANGAHISVGKPVAKSVGQSGGGMYGHVFWVESINSDGSVNVTEYNNAQATMYETGSFHYGDFGTRVLTAAEATMYNYLWP